LALSQCAVANNQPPVSSNPVSSNKAKPAALDVTLEANYRSLKFPGQTGREVRVMTYNGQIPGPLLEAHPGDTVRLQLRNALSQPTNLHYHGLHIPPTGKVDNIFIDIPPGETFTYEFSLPKNHPSGIFYYHPHLHELVATQVFAGLGGIFVVRGELDEIPEIKAAQEQFLFLKDFAAEGWDGSEPMPRHMERIQGREGAILTVNGQVNPSISLPQRGLLRLRIVNASTSRFYRLSLEDHPLYLIATDGGAIAEPIELQELLLSPGERAEVLVRGERPPGRYQLLNLPYNRGSMGMMHGMGGGMMDGFPRNPDNQRPQVLATLTYQGSGSALALPKQLLAVETLPEPAQTRRIEMSMAMRMGMGMGMQFMFNGQPFDHRRVDIPVRLGTVEDWELVNIDPDRMDHPFHLHTNLFQVVSRNGRPEPYRAWKDTVLVKGGETVRIRIPFRDFTGKTVYHCHILDHEDLGMMGVVDIRA
jgi:FtsP/CotA-like multicopper oxidase with cupredoxin domain